MAIEILRKIGLSGGEIKVYSALLDSGQSTVNRLHEKTGIERRNIYDILNKLIERGLVAYIVENKKRLFQASDPKKIIDYIEEKKGELGRTESEVRKELPRLSRQFRLRMPEIYSEVYRGYDGIKAIWEDSLNYDTIYWIGAGRYVPKALPAWFGNWNRRRIRLGIQVKNLLRHEMRKEIRKPWQLEEIRFLPKEFSGNPAGIGIHGPKVVHYLFGSRQFGFIIQSEEIASNYRRYHKYLWEKVAEE